MTKPQSIRHTQETLLQAIQALAYRQFVVFFVLWLTIGMPIACQQHGMMTLFDMELHASISDGDHLSHTQAPTDSPCSVHNHQPGAVMQMSVLGIGVLPQGFVLDVSHSETILTTTYRSLLPQWKDAPPTPPPRWV